MKTEININDNNCCKIVLEDGGSKILAALVDCGDYEIGVRCNLDGTCRDNRKEDLFNFHIEVPNNENRLSK